jgi:hypothetical protein
MSSTVTRQSDSLTNPNNLVLRTDNEFVLDRITRQVGQSFPSSLMIPFTIKVRETTRNPYKPSPVRRMPPFGRRF